MKFYKLPETKITINIDKVISIGMFQTYTDHTKSTLVQKYMIKFEPIVKGHPYSLDITKTEHDDLVQFLTTHSFF